VSVVTVAEDLAIRELVALTEPTAAALELEDATSSPDRAVHRDIAARFGLRRPAALLELDPVDGEFDEHPPLDSAAFKEEEKFWSCQNEPKKPEGLILNNDRSSSGSIHIREPAEPTSRLVRGSRAAAPDFWALFPKKRSRNMMPLLCCGKHESRIQARTHSSPYRRRVELCREFPHPAGGRRATSRNPLATSKILVWPADPAIKRNVDGPRERARNS